MVLVLELFQKVLNNEGATSAALPYGPFPLIFVLKNVFCSACLEQFGCNLCSGLWSVLLIFVLKKSQTNRVVVLLCRIVLPYYHGFDA